MTQYTNSIALAKRLIEKFGQVVTVQNHAGVAPVDPLKPWDITSSTQGTAQQSHGVFLEYAQKFIDGETIRRGDQRVLIPAVGLTDVPRVDGLIIRNSEKWRIRNVRPLSPGGESVLYEVQVRQ